eukprot:CAMPEP_0201573910 /NCGR_PEP_ID=MMETSP0190_2-20130828/18025_1 /ASSEMBLY_ACC=CAM_ASM_000263 /TAXON_ID=37353 /ORGANISM="Rosalina sp." /LENGTH=30 /DNA_ID= /DNA_START= /DNA_END= /DNA_ORIENTATION=
MRSKIATFAISSSDNGDPSPSLCHGSIMHM